jgi:hypothetical protein
MSQENVEIVRRAFEFFERGEAPFEVADPEIRIDNIPESPIPGPTTAMRGFAVGGRTLWMHFPASGRRSRRQST